VPRTGARGPLGRGLLYNIGMSGSAFDEMKEYIGFSAADAAHVAALAPYVAPHLKAIADRFYLQIARHRGARAVLEADPQRLARLHESFADWLATLFCGRYDAEYYEQRAEIGHAHVRIGLPQHYMFGGMEIVWQELERVVRQSHVPDASLRLQSLHKLLTLETTVMLESYQLSYSEEVRRGERHAVQERLTRAEHLAHIGQMAASLAHEIKNPLAGISGAIQVIRDGLPADDDRRPILGDVLRQITRLDGTVRDLLVYARPKPPRLRSCDLNEVVERVLTFMSGEPELRRVRVEFTADASLPLVEADETQIEQVLINLVLNAAQASPDGGQVHVYTELNETHMRLAVEDRGHGMHPDVQARAFEPFFTTKARGTGLGLPICRRIVELHSGTIEVASQLGRGTRVTVELPRKRCVVKG
jgi:signal transduction histidine kinase